MTFEDALVIVRQFPTNVLLNIAAQVLVNAENNPYKDYVADYTDYPIHHLPQRQE